MPYMLTWGAADALLNSFINHSYTAHYSDQQAIYVSRSLQLT